MLIIAEVHCRWLIRGAVLQAVHEACSKIGRVQDGVVYLENASLIFTGVKP